MNFLILIYNYQTNRNTFYDNLYLKIKNKGGADTERIMAYRLLSIARGEKAELPGYNDEMYVLKAAFDKQSMQDLLENFIIVRQSTVHLLKSLDKDAWLQRGNANKSTVTIRALAYIIAGHELHHLQIIKERYFGSNAYPLS